MKWARWTAAVALGATAALTSVVALANHVEGGHLVAVGPTSPLHGYPVWYRDARGLSLELCYDHQDPLCNVPVDHVPDFTQPVSFPDNFPEESFWWAAESTMTTSAGDAILVLALEGAWNAEVVRDGDQVSFGRVRIRVDLNQPGLYTITHPYGVDTFEVTTTGRRAINETEDIGLALGNFSGALDSRIGPFLVWNDEAPAPPAGYIGDPAVPHRVVGSPFIDPRRPGVPQNVFRIEGPNVGTPGSPFLCEQNNLNCIQTELFNVQGKIATISGVSADRVTYARDEGGAVSLAAFASSNADQVITLAGDGVVSEEPMQGEEGRYFGFAEVTGLPPAQVTITNESDVPPSVQTAAVRDLVTITRAEYDPIRFELLVEAASSDQLPPGPTLDVVGYGPLSGGVQLFTGVVAPPASITVVSSAGGSDTEPVAVSGEPFAPIPVAANAGVDQTVQSGSMVMLDGTASSGNITGLAWLQSQGPAVILSDASSRTPTFMAVVPGTYVFQLTVNGFGGPSVDTVQINVVEGPPPVANAGADRFVAAGALVTLDASGSSNATSYAWQQISGSPIVSLTGANTAQATFTFPEGATALLFEVTVSGPGGSATDTVVIAPEGTEPPAPVANAGPDRTVPVGSTVTLDGSGSANATSYAWTQIAGPTVVLTGANSAQASFVFPGGGATSVSFQLTVTNSAGASATDTVVITAQAPPPPPVANAGPDQVVAAGALVVLDGSATTGASSIIWEQIGGTPAVVLAGATTPNPTFTFPGGATTLVFQLTATGADGVTTSSDTVSIAPLVPVVDVLTVTRAEFRTDDARWNIRGTATVTTGNVVTVFLGNGTTVVGTAAVEAAGAWRIDLRGSAVVPAPNERLVIRSSAGGSLTNVTLQQRR